MCGVDVRDPIDPVVQDFADQVGDDDAIAICGQGTHGDLGGAVDDSARVVRAPSGVVCYRPEEMTVTVRAGTPVAELHALLADTNQVTALPESGTVGGALAVGFDGIFALGRGRCRDALLQVRYVSAQGKVITGGAAVVKNVSGFDLPRLLVGSLGTIGVIAEVVLRTNPLPAVRRLVQAPDVDPMVVFDRIQRPQVVLWDGQTTWVELGGHPPTVESDYERLAELGDWTDTETLPVLPENRWSLPPAAIRQLGGDSPSTGAFVASVGTGTVFASLPQPPRSVAPPLRALHERIKLEFDPANRLNPGRSTIPAPKEAT